MGFVEGRELHLRGYEVRIKLLGSHKPIARVLVAARALGVLRMQQSVVAARATIP